MKAILAALCFTSLALTGYAQTLPDQGHIYGTHDVATITADSLSQSITTGISGQLSAIQLQFNASIPVPAPRLQLAIFAGGNPPEGKPLFSEELFIDSFSYQDTDIFTWNLSDAGLFFDAGEQTFAPTLVVSHTGKFRLFSLAQPASPGLEILAESGDTRSIIEEVGERVVEAIPVDQPLGPGQSTVVVVAGTPGTDYLTVAAMLVPTNDSFVAKTRVRLPVNGVVQSKLLAYDAGTELNDQSCAHIPGTHCGGEGYSAETGEGFVHIISGVHGLGGMDARGYEVISGLRFGWMNPAGRIIVQRMQ